MTSNQAQIIAKAQCISVAEVKRNDAKNKENFKDNLMTILRNSAIRCYKRLMTPQELQAFCENDLKKFIAMKNEPEAGKLIEFFINEYYQKILGCTLFKKDFEIESQNFVYSGHDRADLRAARILDSVLEIIGGSSKYHSQAKGIKNSEMEGILTDIDSFRPYVENYFKNRYTSTSVTALLVSRHGTTHDYKGWVNQQQSVKPDTKFKTFVEEDLKKMVEEVAYYWGKRNYNYITEDKISKFFRLDQLRYHQKRLLDRYLKADTLNLLIDWACRQGKTLAACMLIKHRWLNSGKNLLMKNLIISHIPTLLPQWEDAIKWVFADQDPQIHYHKSKQYPISDPNRHLFVLSSNQMLNPEDKDQDIDKETNKQVIYSVEWDNLIYDEAHLALGTDNTLKQLVSKIKRKNFIGCSATPWTAKLMDGSLFKDVDRWTYDEALALKKKGHPDYQELVEEITLILKPDSIQMKKYKQWGIDNFGYNIESWTTDQTHLNAIIDIFNYQVFSKNYLRNDINYTLLDGIIRVGEKAHADLLADTLRNYIDPISQKKLPIEVGVAHGDKFDLPGTLYPPDKGVGTRKWLRGVKEWLSLPKPPRIKKRVLIIVGQGHTGVTLPQINWSTDLGNTKGLMVSTQFKKRTGSSMDNKNFCFHFDLNPGRALALHEQRRKSVESSTDTIFNNSTNNPLLNLWEVTGNNLKELSQQDIQTELNSLLAKKTLGEILPSAEGVILTTGLFDSYDVKKTKRLYTGVELTQNNNSDFDLDENNTTTKETVKSSRKQNNHTKNIDQKSKNALQHLINLLPLMVVMENLEKYKK